MGLLGAVNPLRERREVQRHLFEAPIAQELDRLDDEELCESVRRRWVTAHERQRHRVAAVARHEMQYAADRAGLIPGEDEQRVMAVRTADRVHRHREPALRSALAPAVEHLLDLLERP